MLLLLLLMLLLMMLTLSVVLMKKSRMGGGGRVLSSDCVVGCLVHKNGWLELFGWCAVSQSVGWCNLGL
jgi:hypothetical protein